MCAAIDATRADDAANCAICVARCEAKLAFLRYISTPAITAARLADNAAMAATRATIRHTRFAHACSLSIIFFAFAASRAFCSGDLSSLN